MPLTTLKSCEICTQIRGWIQKIYGKTRLVVLDRSLCRTDSLDSGRLGQRGATALERNVSLRRETPSVVSLKRRDHLP